ncbi:hypothetical protein FXW78_13775 [Rhodococcus opacus]|nr:hypothetical protein [Rhodococcus opacus]
MTDEFGPDPLDPWLRKIADAHEAARHTPGVQCRGSVTLIDEAARLRGVAQVELGKAISLQREIETRPTALPTAAKPPTSRRINGGHWVSPTSPKATKLLSSR